MLVGSGVGSTWGVEAWTSSPGRRAREMCEGIPWSAPGARAPPELPASRWRPGRSLPGPERDARRAHCGPHLWTAVHLGRHATARLVSKQDNLEITRSWTDRRPRFRRAGGRRRDELPGGRAFHATLCAPGAWPAHYMHLQKYKTPGITTQKQSLDLQSSLILQIAFDGQREQVLLPQSTSISLPLRMPSPQYGPKDMHPGKQLGLFGSEL